MRKTLVLGPALLAACATAPAGSPIHGVTPGHKCQIDGSDGFIGRAGTAQTGAAIKRASHAAVLRWAPPGVMLTMDYREDRVTVHLDAAKKVTEIRCG
jgi:peptidase inhibitor I78 family protein